MPSDCEGIFPKSEIGSIVTITSTSGRVHIVNNNRWGCNFLGKDLEKV